jgi:single stranded DNA-binding protein
VCYLADRLDATGKITLNPLEKEPAMNHIEIVGNIGKDPQLRYSPTGASYIYFSIADNSHKKTDPKNKVQWWDCVAFGAVAEEVGMYKRGQYVHVLKGRLEDKTNESGTKKQVVVREISTKFNKNCTASDESKASDAFADSDVPY